ncbi:hypothetical protein AEAC466_19980 [Asticcacaulis sp. AC466]|nr:hypothetical protein AEAC466_19980 [Asticcacaulis sp. AC466]
MRRLPALFSAGFAENRQNAVADTRRFLQPDLFELITGLELTRPNRVHHVIKCLIRMRRSTKIETFVDFATYGKRADSPSNPLTAQSKNGNEYHAVSHTSFHKISKQRFI